MKTYEALIRARESCAQTSKTPNGYRAGLHDDSFAVRSVLHALAHLDDPAPIEPDVLALRELCAAVDKSLAEEYRRGEFDIELIAALPIFRKHKGSAQ